MSAITKQEIREAKEISVMAAALRHVTRVRLLRAMAAADRPRSPTGLADDLDEALGNVSYHMRTLATSKLIKLAKKRQVRGAIEHYYELTAAGRDALRLLNSIRDGHDGG